MDIKNIFSEDRAVSPVIGVILMVAITVILAAVIGAFVIGIGDDQEVQPTASFSFDFSSADGEESPAEVTIAHSTGDTIDSPDSLFVSIDGERSEWTDGEFEDADYSFDEIEYPVRSGSQVTVTKDQTSEEEENDDYIDWEGESLSVVWESETGDSSATLSSSDAPN